MANSEEEVAGEAMRLCFAPWYLMITWNPSTIASNELAVVSNMRVAT